jgi:cytoskeletal protein CcmA (bactofilin family)
MQNQLSNQPEDQLAGQSTPQLQRITYRTSAGDTRDGNPTYLESATDMEQHYQPLERLHDVGLHGWGIAAGLQVAFASHQTGVTVRPGIALDSNGLHILLMAGGQADISTQSDGPGTQTPVFVNTNGVSVPTTGLTGEQFLVVRFFETVNFSTHFCTHTPWVRFVAPANLPTNGSDIVLAKITFDSGSNAGQVLTVSQNGRQSAHRQIEHAHEFMTQGPAVVTGLNVSATPNSAGITVSPGLALDSNGRYISLSSGGKAEVGLNADAPGATPTLVNVSDSGVFIPTTGLTGFKFLTGQHWETPEAITLPIPSNTLQTAPVRFLDTPRFQFVDTSNITLDSANVILAGITFGSGGVVMSLSADVRPGSALSTGSFHVLKNMTTSPSENSLSVVTGEAGAIVPMSNGVALTVSGAEDEIHLNATSVQTSGDLVVNGEISVNGDVAMENALVDAGLSVGGVAAVHGDLTTGGTLNVTAAAHIQGDVSAGGSLEVMGPTTAKGDVTANGSLTVTGSTTANGPLAAKGNATIGGTLTVTGSTTTNTLTARGNILLTNTGSSSEAGMLHPTGNGLALTVPSASNEIHLENDNGGSIAKVSLSATKVVVRDNNQIETVTISPNIGNISSTSVSAIGNINSASVSTTNLSATNLSATGNVAIGVVTPRTQLHVLGRISTGLDFSSAGAITFFPPDGFAWFHIDNGPAGGRPTGRLRFSFGANPGDNEVMSIDQGRNVRITGNFSVTGQKSFVQDHPTSPKKQIVYVSLEGGEAGTYIRGTGTLIDGKAVVELPEHFGLVTHKEGLTIQLTPRGEWLQLYVVELNTSQVVVREVQGKNGQFDYFVQGMREGYEDHQVIQEKTY